MALAFFDMDGTLVDCDTNDVFLHHLVEIGIVDKEFLKPLRTFQEIYFKGKLKIEDFVDYAIKPLVGLDKDRLDSIIKPCIEDKIYKFVKKGAFEAIKFHQDRGDEIAIVSATVDYIVEPLANKLGISHVIATPTEHDNEGRLTGKLCGVVPNLEGKQIRINAFVKEHNFSLVDSYAYGDSLNDVQMLELVDHKFAIDPNEAFRASDKIKQFTVKSWK